MLHFLDPEAFPSMDKFLAKYRKDESGKYQAEDIMRLREKIKPYLLKRDKEDVDLELPEKEETVSLAFLSCELATLHLLPFRSLPPSHLLLCLRCALLLSLSFSLLYPLPLFEAPISSPTLSHLPSWCTLS